MRVVISVTGASGSIYAVSLIKALKQNTEAQLTVIGSDLGLQVCQFETKVSLKNLCKELDLTFYKQNQLFADEASGTVYFDAHVIIPCSMGTLARISNGISSNLIERVADVTIKEKRKLILSIRESPLNSIHCENLLKMSKIEGVYILPPMIAFYKKPKTIDEVIKFHIGKIFNLLDLPHSFFKPWGRSTKEDEE